MPNHIEINGVQITGPGEGPAPPFLYVRIGSRGVWKLAHTQTRDLVELAAAIAGMEYVRYCDVDLKRGIGQTAYDDARRRGVNHHDAIAIALDAVKQHRSAFTTPQSETLSSADDQ